MRSNWGRWAGVWALALTLAPGCDDEPSPTDAGRVDAAGDMGPTADVEPADAEPADAERADDLGAVDMARAPDAGPSNDPAVVDLAQGRLRGVEDEGVVGFLGVPFAAPPVGDRRWRAPAPAEPWDGERLADSWPSPCTQVPMAAGEPIGDEDCLYLNVWRPVDAQDAPVMVFIHGGGNMFGSTSEFGSGRFTYEGATLARRTGAIVVTVQYRLNILGYLADPAFAEEDGSLGNWGLRDQIAGLRWVSDHIAGFGGDPERVLLFGESGGASSVCGLVATPAAGGLFHAAVMQSGGCGGMPLDRSQAWSDGVVEAMGCADAADRSACLRALDAGALAAAASAGQAPDTGLARTPAGPTIDGVLLPSSPLIAMARGEHNHMPLVFGANAEETAWPFFGIVGAGQVWTPELYEARIRLVFGANADAVLAQYAVGPGGFANEAAALIAVTTDVQFVCPTRSYARAAAASQAEPVYRFLYAHPLAGGAPGLRLLGAFHGVELLFNFQHVDLVQNYAATADDIVLQAAFAQYWGNLAETGAPGEFEGVGWPVYDAQTDPYVELAIPIENREGLRTARCDFWEALAGP